MNGDLGLASQHIRIRFQQFQFNKDLDPGLAIPEIRIRIYHFQMDEDPDPSPAT